MIYNQGGREGTQLINSLQIARLLKAFLSFIATPGLSELFFVFESSDAFHGAVTMLISTFYKGNKNAQYESNYSVKNV